MNVSDYSSRGVVGLSPEDTWFDFPSRDNLPDGKETLVIARSSLQRTLIRMQKDSDFCLEYQVFMKEYADLGHKRSLRGLPESAVSQNCFYLPHHGIWQPSDNSRKLRVVFNESSRTKGVTSLNDLLHTGPALQTDIVSIFLRWRTHRFAMTSDIEKMYRQIEIDERDVDYPRIVWQPALNSPEEHYQLPTLTYGLSCAPYLALRVIQQLSEDEHARFPNAAEVLRRSTYVDDIFFGADDHLSALQLRDEMINLLRSGGFPLRKWVANNPKLTSDLSQHERLRPCWKDFNSDQPVRTLGLAWDRTEDAYRYKAPRSKELAPATKRSALSKIARLFDPLGWLSPVIIRAKILLQEMWQCKLDWDDRLSSPLLEQWQEFVDLLPSVELIRLPRWRHSSYSHF